MNQGQVFAEERRKNISRMGKDKALKELALKFLIDSADYKYTYNFTWLGRPIIQFPQDILAIQEIIWRVKPDLIVETGIAHGGSIILSASILEMINQKGQVVGIDIDIRKHNRKAIEDHPLSKRIIMLEGSSTDQAIINKVNKMARDKKVMVFLDSLHTYNHVLKELNLYSKIVSKGSYIVVFDTVIENMPRGIFNDRPWDVGNNPYTATQEFLKKNKNFSIDKEIDNKILISSAPSGYLKRIR